MPNSTRRSDPPCARPRETLVHGGHVWHATGRVAERQGTVIAEYERRRHGEATGEVVWATADGRRVVAGPG